MADLAEWLEIDSLGAPDGASSAEPRETLDPGDVPFNVHYASVDELVLASEAVAVGFGPSSAGMSRVAFAVAVGRPVVASDGAPI